MSGLLAELKGMIEARQRWRTMNETWSYFESNGSLKKWDKQSRFVFVRQKCKEINNEPIQLDVFVAHEYGYDFKVQSRRLSHNNVNRVTWQQVIEWYTLTMSTLHDITTLLKDNTIMLASDTCRPHPIAFLNWIARFIYRCFGLRECYACSRCSDDSWCPHWTNSAPEYSSPGY